MYILINILCICIYSERSIEEGSYCDGKVSQQYQYHYNYYILHYPSSLITLYYTNSYSVTIKGTGAIDIRDLPKYTSAKEAT